MTNFIGGHGDPAGSTLVTHPDIRLVSLTGSVGTGNIAGVATAVVAGGPGAIFWIWCYVGSS